MNNGFGFCGRYSKGMVMMWVLLHPPLDTFLAYHCTDWTVFTKHSRTIATATET